jgi:hypothetical protein
MFKATFKAVQEALQEFYELPYAHLVFRTWRDSVTTCINIVYQYISFVQEQLLCLQHKMDFYLLLIGKLKAAVTRIKHAKTFPPNINEPEVENESSLSRANIKEGGQNMICILRNTRYMVNINQVY